MGKKQLVVVGATGVQGDSVINAVLQDKELSKTWTIRGITRNPTSAAGEALRQRDIEVVKADTSDESSLMAAFEGAHVVFGVTNYWESQNKELEIQQGKNMANASKKVGAFFIFSSLPSVVKASNGECTNVPYWDSKAEVEDYVRGLAMPAAFVWAGFYMENMPKVLFKLNETDNRYNWSLPCPLSARLPLIDCTNDLGLFVTPILRDQNSFNGERVLGATESISIAEMTETYNSSKSEGTAVLEYHMSQPESWLLAKWGYFGGASLEGSVALLDRKSRTWRDFVLDRQHPAWSKF